jgi:phosphatidylglycerophosphate synthase
MSVSVKFLSIGTSEKRVFGNTAKFIMQKQLDKIITEIPITIIANAEIILSIPALQWLIDNPGHIIIDNAGFAMIGSTFTAHDHAMISFFDKKMLPSNNFILVKNGTVEIPVRKLRRRELICAIDLNAADIGNVEKQMFDRSYKGITDIVTSHIWPYPAFYAVRLFSYLRMPPNYVTIIGMIFMIIASWSFFAAEWAIGLGAAWVMTFLDTVDGKLARVTGTSSKLGDILDHGMDWVHPPVWWICVAIGIGSNQPLIWESCIIILSTYAMGRLSEASFKRHFGFNQYLWKPIDGKLRSVIARRNINLLILSFGFALKSVSTGFILVALWSIASIGLQTFRFVQAIASERRGIVITNCIS